MSKLEQKYLQDYSLDTLRDLEISSPSERQYIQYDATAQKWKNTAKPVFGEDASDDFLDVPASNANTPILYHSLTFSVNSLVAVNKYRLSANFAYNANKSNRLFIAQLRLDGNIVRSIELAAEDSSSYYDGSLLFYAEDLSIGNHTLELFFGTSSNNTTAIIRSNVLEVWRTQ